jgi:hemin uptake protein HemP
MRTKEEAPGAIEGATSAAAASAPSPPGPRRLDSAALFQRAREIVIVHGGQEYRLRITKADKLILTK